MGNSARRWALCRECAHRTPTIFEDSRILGLGLNGAAADKPKDLILPPGQLLLWCGLWDCGHRARTCEGRISRYGGRILRRLRSIAARISHGGSGCKKGVAGSLVFRSADYAAFALAARGHVRTHRLSRLRASFDRCDQPPLRGPGGMLV